MDRCAKCDSELGVGRYCLNCGHQIGAPLPAETTTRTTRTPAERHQTAARQARRLQERGRSSLTERAAVGSAGAVDPDADWFLPGSPVEDEPTRLHWAAWVLAALALVAAVLYGLSYLDERSAGDAADPTADTAGTGQVQPSRGDGGDDGGRRPSGPVVDLARQTRIEVPASAPPSTDLDGTQVSFEAGRMVDGARRTAWRMPGDGTGAEIRVVLDRPAVITEVGIVNGYSRKVAGVDWYPKHRRVREVTWTFDDGTSVEQSLEDRRKLQRMEIEPVRTRTVTLTLDRVTIPGSGSFARDYTPISTLVLKGRPVG